MKEKRLLIIVSVLVLCAAVTFAGLWITEKNDYTELEELCSYSAGRAYNRFSEYRESGHTYDFVYGVAELESFCNGYKILAVAENGCTDTDYSYLNQLIGVLMDKPDLSEDQKDMLVSISWKLNQNIRDLNAYDDIFALYNELTR